MTPQPKLLVHQGSPGSNESDVPEEFYYFRDLICPKLFRENVPRNKSVLQREGWIAEIMSTPHAGRFYDNIRMTKPCFNALVDALSLRRLLPQGQSAWVSNIEEVAIFMQTVGMHKRHRDSMERFQHSLETIHRRFHRVLSALCALALEMITRPNWTYTHPKIASNPEFYPYFKDCIGAMDGTLIPAWAPQIDQNRYRSRKGRIGQNVLAICDFHMNFTYVYAGWEGSAADARILDDAISQDLAFPFPPLGKYYLVDVGFTNYQCFLAPYQGTRYHLAEYRGQGGQYRTPQDMFNHAHSRLRNVIERFFGVLKKRFSILQWGMPSYLMRHQVKIVIVCCTLHNFIHRFSQDDNLFNEPNDETPGDLDAFYHRGRPNIIEVEA
ncbi:UNVERIFIED_CONTAM: hypothetical protein Sradi_0205300 [Sesamum radiatum]|uniref:DDE Tnp4 domain-containing protein n=1 Tax=Sesamum radiatum TaxID=300843 RepID=A0AAW2VZ96_SESRA